MSNTLKELQEKILKKFVASDFEAGFMQPAVDGISWKDVQLFLVNAIAEAFEAGIQNERYG